MGSLIKTNGSCHWYQKDATPCFSVIGKNGKERNTTVKDARELGLVPSVTTVLSLIAKPALESWKVEQGILQSLTLPKLENESNDAFAKRVVEELDNDKTKTLGKGTRIHAAIEAYLNKEQVEIEDDIKENLREAILFITNKEFQGTCEQRLANDMFAGTLDFIGKVNGFDNIIVDFKTQSIKEKPVYYDEWKWQLAAYRKLTGMDCLCANMIIGTNMNMVDFKVYDKEEIEQAENVFTKALDLFYAMKKLEEKPVNQLCVKLDSELFEKFKDYCNKNNLKRVDLISNFIKNL